MNKEKLNPIYVAQLLTITGYSKEAADGARLVLVDNLTQEQAAKKANVSQSSISRVIRRFHELDEVFLSLAEISRTL